ncbi:MAG: cation:proton antiporter [Lachnospiraceae bacterium]|nr:cation:proton antiporter [Lachnospiraceae bacterium]
MESYAVLKDLALIVIFAKLFGLVARKLRAPQVVGEIIAGVIIGPSLLGLVSPTPFISSMAEVGVILLMFSAGLGTDLKQLMKTGPQATLVACCGVFVPLICGALLYMGFYGASPWGDENFYRAVFVGVILTATSVSITAQTLKEMGKISTKIGTLILSAAIIDDVIGILVLTFVIGFKDPGTKPLKVVISTILFFILALIVGVISYKIFKKIDERYPHTRRIPIAGLAYCFAFSYIAERFFGIADITGAYVAGIILCSIDDSDYIERKVDINSYMIFGPVFFASIGLKTTFDNISTSIIAFTVCFILVGLLSKIIGCGLMAKICGYDLNDSLKVGIGMMTRGEVALIVSQKGLSVGLLDSNYFTCVILLIIVSSVLTPILLKLIYSKDRKETVNS